MATRALVLGGGGPVGVAWETGLAAGLDQEGLRLAEADLIVGTSAGSIVGSQLALGRSPQEMLARQLEPETERSGHLRGIDLGPLMAQFRRLFTSELPLEQRRAEMGAFALQAETISEEEWLASFGSVGELSAWPERPFVCTAIDTADGTFVTWDRDAGVDLALAVASSCAVPGIVPPVTINGRRYMDGGIGSTTNAHLAAGYDRVLVVPVVVPPPGPLRERFERELQDVRDGGSAVEVILPDEGSRQAFGPNFMDPTRRREVAEAGLRQGRAEAARLKEWWA